MKRPSRKFTLAGNGLLIIVILAVYCLGALGRPLPALQPVTANLQLKNPTASAALKWPAVGQAAVGINPSGVLALHGEQTAIPIASTAKVLTALMVLKQRPLAAHQSGPKITLTSADVKIYHQYVAGDGSVSAVTAGETLTEYQMLQAILLPSANNIADSLAIWAFGSLPAYANFANGYIRQLGLTHTHVGSDASGYDPTTVSTAHDLVLLGEAAMQEPALAEIVGQTSADLPVAGKIQNVNGLLGTDGIIGVKTGNTEQAGGVFLAAKQATIAGKKLILIAAVVGSNSLYDAMVGSLPLLASAQENFSAAEILPAKTVVGSYKLPWGGTVTAVSDKPLATLAWNGSMIPSEIKLKAINPSTKPGQIVGAVQLPQSPVSAAQTVSASLSEAISQPSVTWRLRHPI
ncbi:MAG: serine hydrolase [Patescibacteria group bacterium]|nr:serine hydrolase [Patescibacteria group bacterium]